MKTIKELTDAQNALIDEIQEFAESKNLVNENTCPIYDGVADIESYLKTSLKIMWVMKEPYDDKDENGRPIGGGWYMWEAFERENAWKQKSWKGMTYAVYGFRNNLYWDKLPAIRQNKNMLDELKSVAYINMSKMPGLNDTKDSQAQSYYNLWKDILHKQMEVYEPDVFIFGGTFRFFYNPKELESSMQECFVNPDVNPSIKAVVYKYNGRWLISVRHPSRDGEKEVYIDTLIDALKYVDEHK